ncbi:HAMP domain-containing sensor histidine kinase [Streptomyces sp. Ag109_G2-15]|uniref:sensor histidine kinase n=1 Tax=Streptomyces sp. Ag109_G2-15 TaxID=1938850 RepID=UPI000BD895BF|nr:HAMP domain-containing sensor histidine kinase [Streptomyces sp. Ag109_G2-15]SOE06722.1 Signal transduction histidine kinase [Streptomyces sp. Ag109_G2-15]
MTRRLLLSYLSLILLVLLALEVPFGYVYARGELSRLSHAVGQGAAGLSELCEDKIEHSRTADIPALARSYARSTGSRVVVTDRDGVVLTDTRTTALSAGQDWSARPDIAAALHSRPASGTVRDTTTGAEAFYTTVPGTSGDTVRCAVRVAYPLTALNERVHHAWVALAGAGLGVLAAVAMIGFALARWITRPVRALEHATAQLAEGRLTDPPDTSLGPPELRRLAASFTHTAARLQHLLRAQEAFASEASHQLKTPLTALRLRLENFEPHLHPRARPGLDAALGEVERLSRMVQGLLALARLENSATTPESADLDAVVADRAAMWAAFAAEQDVDFLVTGPDAGHVWAVPGGLEQIIDNLLSNALRVSPPGSVITLARAHGPHGPELHVIDQGPGMTETARRRAFDRFWRACDTPDDGTGLGLTMVQQFTRAAGGEVTLHPAPGGGLAAVVRLRQSPGSADQRTPMTLRGAAFRPWVS